MWQQRGSNRSGKRRCLTVCIHRTDAQELLIYAVLRFLSVHGGIYQSAFTRQRSLVRAQHRPLGKSHVLQVKRQPTVQVPRICQATVQQRTETPAN